MKQSATKRKPNDLDQLRNELIQKCSHKLISAYPHVFLKRLPEKLLGEDNSDNLSMELIEGRLKLSKSKKSSLRNLISYKKRVRKSTKILQHSLQKRIRTKVGPTHSTILNNLKLEPVQQVEADESTQSQDVENISQAKDIKIDISETFLAKIEQNKEYFDSDDENTPPGSPEKLMNSPENSYPRKLRKVHKCSPCNKTFSTLESLSAHQKKSECLDSRTSSEEENESGGSKVDEEAAEVDDDNYEANEASESDAESLHSSIEKEVILKEDVDSEEGDLKDEESEEDQESDNEGSVDEAYEKKYLIVKNKRGRWQCCFCKKSFPPAGKLRVHILSKHPPKWSQIKFKRKSNIKSCDRFKCPNCKNKFFEKAHLLLLHWKKVHQSNDSSPLPVELVSFTSDPNTKIFQSLHKDLQKPKFFAKIEVPVPDKIFICDEQNCKRPFYSEEDLETHKKLHGSFSCKLCPETKTFLPELAYHELQRHRRTTSQNNQKCPRCDFKFALKDFPYFYRHYCFAHFSLKFSEHSCPVCKIYLVNADQSNEMGKLFKHLKHSHDLTNLKSSKAEIFRCNQENCKAYFFKLYSLDFHKKVDHELTQIQMEKVRKARQNVCEVCGKGFKNENKLNVHFLSHSGPESWQFSCKICAKKCLNESKLKEHMRVHTNEKPFVCEVCGAKYAHRHNLRIHVNSKHGDVVQDIPKKYNSSNLSSRKGIKRKCHGSLEEAAKKKRLQRKKERKALEDTDSEEDAQR